MNHNRIKELSYHQNKLQDYQHQLQINSDRIQHMLSLTRNILKNKGNLFANLPDVGIPESQGEMQPISQVSSMESDAMMYHDDTPPMSNLSTDAEDSQQSVFSQENNNAEDGALSHETNPFSDESIGDCSRQGPTQD